MEKRISFYEFQSIKHVAEAMEPLLKKKARVEAEIKNLGEQYKGIDTQLKSYEAGVVSVIGLPVSKLVVRTTVTDKNGNPVKKFMPTDIVSYDEKTKQYVINVPDEGGNGQEAPAAQAPAAEAAPEAQPAEQENPFRD